MMEETISIKKNDFLRQFEALVDNELITIEFAEQDRKTFLTKMVISDHLKEDGYVNIVVKSVLDILKEEEVKVVPTCIEVKSFIRRNKMLYQSMLPVGIAL
ncbi:GNAT family N-acetyltransferase [Psychroflexus planctonicus]|nr:N-acetyltransferase [Psychroflexus planctonicus]